jgi:type III secretory pathway component EscV
VTFAILPEPTQGLLSAFRDAMAETNQKKLVVVTQAAAIRPFVRRLLSYEFPEITVLSADELRPDLKSRITRTVEYGTA